MKLTLIIGLGGTGVKVGHALKKRLFTFFSDEELTANANRTVQFLFLENDTAERERALTYVGDRRWFDPNDFVWIPPFSPLAYKQDVLAARRPGGSSHDKAQVADLLPWFDERCDFPAGTTDAGMAANRQMGKLAFFLTHGEFAKKLKDRLARLQDAAGGGAGRGDREAFFEARVAIYVISSICGGTGSSTFLDVAATIDSIADQNTAVKKRAVLVCPRFYLDKLKGAGKHDNHPLYRAFQMNAWAVMAESEFYRKYREQDPTLLAKHSSIPVRLKGRIDVGRPFSPFHVALLFDEQTQNNQRIGSDRFYDFIADSMFELVAGSANQDFESDLTNEKGGPDAYRRHKTLAVKVIEFPRTTYGEYFRLRFLHDVFSTTLLGDHDQAALSACADRAVELAETAIPGRLSELAAQWRSAFGTKSQAKSLSGLAKGENYGDDRGKLVSDADLLGLFKKHENAVRNYSDAVGDYFAQERVAATKFDKDFNNGSSAPDVLRREVLSAVGAAVKKFGYPSVLFADDSSKTKGLLRELATHLQAQVKKLAASAQAIDDDTSLSLRREKARAALRAAVASYRFGRPSVDKLQLQINAYSQSLAETYEKIWLRQLLVLQADVLKAFASEQGSVIPGWLQQYHRRLWAAVYPDDSRDSQASIQGRFDDKRLAGHSIKSRFRHHLHSRFAGAARDAFRVSIPFPLQDEVDASGWRSTGALARLYNDSVNGGDAPFRTAEVASIFADDSALGENTLLLAMVGESADKVSANIDAIESRIASHFEGHYLSPTEPLGKFLASTVIEAWSRLSEDRQQQISGSAQRPPVPLSFRTGQPPDFDGPLYVCRYDDALFEAFATKTLGVPAANQIKYKKDELRTKVTFLRVLDNVVFGQITDSDLCQHAYEQRDIDTERPHGFQAWNDHREGPWAREFELSTSGLRFGASAKGTKHHVSGEEALYLGHMIDTLARKSKDVREALFFSTDGLKKHKAKSRPPIALDTTEQEFVYWRHCKLDKEKGKGDPKFGVLGQSVQLPLTADNLGFAEALRVLEKDEDFKLSFRTFFQHVMAANRATVAGALKEHGDVVVAAFDRFREVAREVQDQGREGDVGAANLAMAANSVHRLDEMTKRLFNVKLL